MIREGFSAETYIEEQSKYILERITSGEGRLYLEFGGKLVEDRHAMRVLPGFDENAKIKLLQRMSDQAEIIICIYAGDIIKSKTRQDFGITYDLEVMRLIDEFRSYDLAVNSVVVTRYEDAPPVNQFIAKLESQFKMPLTVINANTEIIEKEKGSDEITKSINRQVRKMTGLVRELRELSVFEESDIVISKTDV